MLHRSLERLLFRHKTKSLKPLKKKQNGVSTIYYGEKGKQLNCWPDHVLPKKSRCILTKTVPRLHHKLQKAKICIQVNKEPNNKHNMNEVEKIKKLILNYISLDKKRKWRVPKHGELVFLNER